MLIVGLVVKAKIDSIRKVIVDKMVHDHGGCLSADINVMFFLILYNFIAMSDGQTAIVLFPSLFFTAATPAKGHQHDHDNHSGNNKIVHDLVVETLL